MMEKKNKINATKKTYAEVYWKTETDSTQSIATRAMSLIKEHFTWTTVDTTPFNEAKNDIQNGIKRQKATQENLSRLKGVGNKIKEKIIKKLQEMEIDIPES